ncbi:hypothetical protein MLD38_034298 [Melastoma candidum]|uniref:Uncharacterized protein n=1 Tax=Melastoma candidum TaxID=119954 RepID=A0ACB9MA12_9MYRT|nr:hypothetical protein MLD38_034298 [Melastoma candidum]
MTHLSLSSSNFQWQPSCQYLKPVGAGLVSLDLLGNDSLKMPGPALGTVFANLSRNSTCRQIICRFSWGFTQYIPDEHPAASFCISSLGLNNSKLPEKLPHYLFQLPKLRKLHLSMNFPSGTLPRFNWSSHLMFLYLYNCSLTGDVSPFNHQPWMANTPGPIVEPFFQLVCLGEVIIPKRTQVPRTFRALCFGRACHRGKPQAPDAGDAGNFLWETEEFPVHPVNHATAKDAGHPG